MEFTFSGFRNVPTVTLGMALAILNDFCHKAAVLNFKDFLEIFLESIDFDS
jgi:hypothetical protein